MGFLEVVAVAGADPHVVDSGWQYAQVKKDKRLRFLP